jgi:hypothetical protein
VRPPKLDRLLSAEPTLQPVLAKARELRALAGLVRDFLPPELQARVANFREGELVLVAENPAIAAKLRLLAPSLISYLAKQRGQVNSVYIRVQPNTSQRVSAAVQKTAQFSTRTLDSLRDLYDSMTSSPARDALRTLLERRGALPKPPPAAVLPGKAAGSGQPGKRRI